MYVGIETDLQLDMLVKHWLLDAMQVSDIEVLLVRLKAHHRLCHLLCPASLSEDDRKQVHAGMGGIVVCVQEQSTHRAACFPSMYTSQSGLPNAGTLPHWVTLFTQYTLCTFPFQHQEPV